jgi:hypothetical protein
LYGIVQYDTNFPKQLVLNPKWTCKWKWLKVNLCHTAQKCRAAFDVGSKTIGLWKRPFSFSRILLVVKIKFPCDIRTFIKKTLKV